MKQKIIITNSVINAPVNQINKNYGSLVLAITIGNCIVIAILIFVYDWKPFGHPYWRTDKSGIIHIKGCRYYEYAKGSFVRTGINSKKCKNCFGGK